jgi:hypothetical protein
MEFLEDVYMNKIINIDRAVTDDNQLQLFTKDSITGLIPKEHILVDSDHVSFIYLMEENDHYTYIVLAETVWPVLKGALDRNLSVLLMSEQDQIELPSFQEELAYVISNIKGNSNYGEKLVEKVEKIFLEA